MFCTLSKHLTHWERRFWIQLMPQFLAGVPCLECYKDMQSIRFNKTCSYKTWQSSKLPPYACGVGALMSAPCKKTGAPRINVVHLQLTSYSLDHQVHNVTEQILKTNWKGPAATYPKMTMQLEITAVLDKHPATTSQHITPSKCNGLLPMQEQQRKTCYRIKHAARWKVNRFIAKFLCPSQNIWKFWSTGCNILEINFTTHFSKWTA